MTFSSYWRHRTEPVCPCNTRVHSKESLFHIYTQTVESAVTQPASGSATTWYHCVSQQLTTVWPTMGHCAHSTPTGNEHTTVDQFQIPQTPEKPQLLHLHTQGMRGLCARERESTQQGSVYSHIHTLRLQVYNAAGPIWSNYIHTFMVLSLRPLMILWSSYWRQ